jgi:hypothetical protein
MSMVSDAGWSVIPDVLEHVHASCLRRLRHFMVLGRRFERRQGEFCKALGSPWLHLEIAWRDCGTPRCLHLDSYPFLVDLGTLLDIFVVSLVIY